MPDAWGGQCQAVGADHGSFFEVRSETTADQSFSADDLRVEQWVAAMHTFQIFRTSIVNSNKSD